MSSTQSDYVVSRDVKRGSESVASVKFDGSTNPFAADPGLFARVYDDLVGFDIKDPTSAFPNARAMERTPVADVRFREILPDMFSNHRPVLEFQRAFSNEIDRQVQPDIDERDGSSRNGLHSSFASIRTVSGYPQLPVSALPRSNSALLQRLGIAERMTDWQVEIARAVWKRVWSHLKPTSIKIPKLSAAGPPRGVSDEIYKLHYALSLIGRPSAVTGYLRAFSTGDVMSLYRDYEVSFVMGTNVRWQVDVPGSPRDYWSSWDVLREASPDKHPITTTVSINGVEYPDFAAMRTRLINAGPWTVNVILQPFATGCMAAMFDNYTATWHMDEDDIDEFLEGKLTFFGDVSSYDHSFTEEKIDLTISSGKEYISEEIMDVAAALYYAPYVSRPLHPEDKGELLVVGDMYDPRVKQVIAGNRSGHAFTSLVAKVWKVIDTLCKFRLMGYDVMSLMDDILRGNMHFGVINNGDDEIVWFESDRDYRMFVSIIDNPPPGTKMFHVKAEIGKVFSGKVYQQIRERSYKAVERITTPFQKILSPERSIGGKFRPNWPLGIIDRYNRRDSHPILEEAWRVFDSMYSRYLEPHYGSFLGILDRAHRAIQLNASDYSWKELQVLDDPDKLHYRFTDDEIREEVQSLAFRKLRPELFMSLFDHHYTGTIQ